MQRHGFDVISAGFGVLFVWLGLVAVIPELSVPASTVWPLLAVAAGVAILVSALRRDTN